MIGILKTFILSIVIVMMLQIRIKNMTIENHILSWSRSTEVSLFLNRVASGAIELGNMASRKAKLVFESLIQDSQSVSRDAKR
jgi:hypothetical protein